MKIELLSPDRAGNRNRVSARVIWEDCDRPTEEIYFETNKAFADDLVCNPHAFLVANVIPAMYYGERRVKMDAEVCQELRLGLENVMILLRHWCYGSDRKLPRLEIDAMEGASKASKQPRAGFFFSGGMDAYGTLLDNRQNYAPEHPNSIKDGVVVFGLEMDTDEAYGHVSDSLVTAARRLDIGLIPVYTNIYLRFRPEDAANDFWFWKYQYGGAALAAVAHAFADRFTTMAISAEGFGGLIDRAIHPLVDPNFSSADLRIQHASFMLSRLDKAKLVALSDTALQHLRVCNKYTLYEAGRLNCGRCEKCIRTMLGLLAVGALEHTEAFPAHDVTASMVETITIADAPMRYVYYELIQPLAEWRPDLTAVIWRKITEFDQGRSKPLWRRKIRRFNKRYLGGRLRHLNRLVPRNAMHSPVLTKGPLNSPSGTYQRGNVVEQKGEGTARGDWTGELKGVVRPLLRWTTRVNEQEQQQPVLPKREESRL